MPDLPGTPSELPAAPAHARLSPKVTDRWPQYRALLIVVTGIHGGPSDEHSDRRLTDAEATALARLGGSPPEQLPEIAAWRDAYAQLGVTPRVARSSLEALLRRVSTGLPRIDRLTDLYNAVSIKHLLPNWRQCVRTRLTSTSTEALFILDALDPVTDAALHAAGDELIGLVSAGAPEARATARVLGGAS